MNTAQPKIVLAPLRGLTESLFRNAYADSFDGIDWAVTPFLTTIRQGRIKPSHLKEVLAENNQRMPVVPQIIGKTAVHFIEMAQALFDLGYAGVNWNIGCPFPGIAKKGRGSGILPYPERIDEFLDSVLSAIPNRLSIKMRLGRYRPEEIRSLWPVLNRYPLEQIMIHPRTGVQMYEGQPHWDIFEECLSNTHHCVIYNGDITSIADIQRLRLRFPSLDTWMIGRGVLADPFLPERIKGMVCPEATPLERFRRFHDRLFDSFTSELMGPRHVVDRMKGYWTYFTRSFMDGPEVLKQIRKCRNVDHYQTVVFRFFNGGAQWKLV